MLIDYKGQKLGFRFKHITDAPTEENPQPRGTICTVTDENGQFVAQSFARLHPKDQFDKNKGRQIALGYALREFVPKEDRFVFWEVYQNWRTTEPRMVLGTKRERKAKIKSTQPC